MREKNTGAKFCSRFYQKPVCHSRTSTAELLTVFRFFTPTGALNSKTTDLYMKM